MPTPSSGFLAWRARVAELAALLYHRVIDGLEEELIAGYEAGDTPAEFLAGIFSVE